MRNQKKKIECFTINSTPCRSRNMTTYCYDDPSRRQKSGTKTPGLRFGLFWFPSIRGKLHCAMVLRTEFCSNVLHSTETSAASLARSFLSSVATCTARYLEWIDDTDVRTTHLITSAHPRRRPSASSAGTRRQRLDYTLNIHLVILREQVETVTPLS